MDTGKQEESEAVKSGEGVGQRRRQQEHTAARLSEDGTDDMIDANGVGLGGAGEEVAMDVGELDAVKVSQTRRRAREGRGVGKSGGEEGGDAGAGVDESWCRRHVTSEITCRGR